MQQRKSQCIELHEESDITKYILKKINFYFKNKNSNARRKHLGMSHGDYFLLYYPIKVMSTCTVTLRHDIKFTGDKY